MAGDDYHRHEQRTLWRLGSFGRERHPPGEAYWFENRSRPEGMMVFQYTVSGMLAYRQDRRLIPVSAGQALLFAYGEDTAYGLPRNATQPYVTEWINLLGAGLREHWTLLRRRSGAVIAIDPDGPVLPAFRALTDLADPRSKATATTIAEAVHSFVMLLFSLQGSELMRGQPPVERALEELLSNPTAPWSLKEIADRHEVSREHLTRVFQKRIGSAPAGWLAAAKLAKAIELLRDSRIPISEVAKQAGFTSTHTMARHVRTASGSSPSALRHRH